jgi:uncharacterized protein (TIGR02118 family)
VSIKWIYLARRNPRWSPEEFRLRWREHSALAGRFKATLGRHFTRVRQCVKVPAALPANWPWPANDYDGMALLWMQSRENLAAARVDPDTVNTMHPDELRVFSDYLSKSTVFAEERVLLDRGGGRVFVLAMLKRAPRLSHEAFGDYWLSQHAPRLLALADSDVRLRKYSQNLVFEDSPGLAVDGVAELWFDSVVDALGFCSADHFRDQVLADLVQFTDACVNLTLLTELNHEKRSA